MPTHKHAAALPADYFLHEVMHGTEPSIHLDAVSPANVWGMARGCLPYIIQAHTEALLDNKKLIVSIGEDHTMASHAAFRLALISQLSLYRDTLPDDPWSRFSTHYELPYTYHTLKSSHLFKRRTSPEVQSAGSDQATLNAIIGALRMVQDSQDLCHIHATTSLLELRRDIPSHYVDAHLIKKQGQQYIDLSDPASIETQTARRLNLIDADDLSSLTHARSAGGLQIRNAIMADLTLQSMNKQDISLSLLFTGLAHLGGTQRLACAHDAHNDDATYPYQNSLSSLLSTSPDLTNQANILFIAPCLPDTPTSDHAIYDYTDDFYRAPHKRLILHSLDTSAPRTYSEESFHLKNLTQAFPDCAKPVTFEPRIEQNARFLSRTIDECADIINTTDDYSTKKHQLLSILAQGSAL